MKAFLDTGFFVALLSARDQWHKKAKAALHTDLALITSSLVVNETVSLLEARGLFSAAIEFLRQIRADETVRIIHIDPPLQSTAWDLFARWGSVGASAVDCTSFAVTSAMNIRRAFTFERRFAAAGYSILP